ncbi:MAG TPA: MaoC family dehydratase N-terminal domain-containing protein [Burkholderiales bacterium]|nr:MaoC family dehydratase N-terminal domain-containing protein [Burkholderiales bacterium]
MIEQLALDASIVGEETGPVEQTLDARWLMAYSAGLGETDARYYDTAAAQGVIAHPLFPVCYEWPLAQPLRKLAALKPLFPRLLHAQHDLAIHRPLRAGETVRTVARIAAVAQRRPGAFVVFQFETRDAMGELVTVSDFGALYRGVRVEGADRLPAEGLEDPPAHRDALPSVGEIAVAATAAHVYSECARIWNPIHTDVAYARAAGLPGIILHGTATLALSISRALRALGVDPAGVRRVRCRFAGMVDMPSTLTVHAALIQGTVLFETRNARGEPVIARGGLTL